MEIVHIAILRWTIFSLTKMESFFEKETMNYYGLKWKLETLIACHT